MTRRAHSGRHLRGCSVSHGRGSRDRPDRTPTSIMAERTTGRGVPGRVVPGDCSPVARNIVSRDIPCVPVLAVVLAHRAPLTLAEIGPPFSPGHVLTPSLFKPLPLCIRAHGVPFPFSCSIVLSSSLRAEISSSRRIASSGIYLHRETWAIERERKRDRGTVPLGFRWSLGVSQVEEGTSASSSVRSQRRGSPRAGRVASEGYRKAVRHNAGSSHGRTARRGGSPSAGPPRGRSSRPDPWPSIPCARGSAAWPCSRPSGSRRKCPGRRRRAIAG